jgi:hypothetical protein
MKAARKKSRKPRRALTPEEQAAAAQRYVDRLERVFAEKVAAWAKLWERCSLAACRRNVRCRHAESCRMLSDAPLTEEGRTLIRDAIAAVEDAPKYDGVKVR